MWERSLHLLDHIYRDLNRAAEVWGSWIVCWSMVIMLYNSVCSNHLIHCIGSGRLSSYILYNNITQTPLFIPCNLQYLPGASYPVAVKRRSWENCENILVAKTFCNTGRKIFVKMWGGRVGGAGLWQSSFVYADCSLWPSLWPTVWHWDQQISSLQSGDQDRNSLYI